MTSITYLLVLLQLYLQYGKHLEKGTKMSIYVCFKDYIICLHNADKGLSSMYLVLQTTCNLVENWRRYSPIFIEATFVIPVVT